MIDLRGRIAKIAFQKRGLHRSAWFLESDLTASDKLGGSSAGDRFVIIKVAGAMELWRPGRGRGSLNHDFPAAAVVGSAAENDASSAKPTPNQGSFRPPTQCLWPWTVLLCLWPYFPLWIL